VLRWPRAAVLRHSRKFLGEFKQLYCSNDTMMRYRWLNLYSRRVFHEDHDMTAEEASLSVLLSFRAQNARSYRDEVELSLLATRIADEGVPREIEIAGTAKPVQVLPAAGIFGTNASGKSRLLHAMADMRRVVLGSFRRGDRTTGLDRQPFLLDDHSRSVPSEFHIDVILNGVRWQYGFEIDDARVHGEYAYHSPQGRRAVVFEREGANVRFGPPFRAGGRALSTLVRENSLLLSVAGAADDKALTSLFRWFVDNLRLAEESSRPIRAAQTAKMLENPSDRSRVLALLRAADLGIADARVASVELNPDARDLLNRAFRILTGHDGEEPELVVNDIVRLTHEGASTTVEVDPEDESKGTSVWVGLIGPVLEAIDEGSVLLADELDASLHPHLVQQLIDLFQSNRSNSRCAQLIFNAHDVSVLGDSKSRALGRDQVWFAEKGPGGATRLHPLTDFGPRHDQALERRYLQGRFGGVPALNSGEFEQAVQRDPASTLSRG